MKNSVLVVMGLVSGLGLAACNSSGDGAGGGGAGGGAGSATTTATASRIEGVRGDRYCEVLLGALDGATVHVKVYNTYGLNECPQADWDALDAAKIKEETGVTVALLNGPRTWVLDAFENSSPLDDEIVTFGALEMRLAGELDIPASEVMSGAKPYTMRAVMRKTVYVFDAGQPVFELVSPEGQVYDMQSFSVQTVPQTMESLADLGAQLALPSGWTFQSRTLSAELKVAAVDGVATVVQDDNGNTYQLSQP